jgi:rod shape determining protein RodA
MAEDFGARTLRTVGTTARLISQLKLDGPLLIGIGLIALYSQIVLYSASGESLRRVLDGSARLLLGGIAMIVVAQIKPAMLRRSAPWLYLIGILLLIVVDAIGYIGKGAQRWLDLGFVRFQPSEIMKIAVPMTVAWYLHERRLPPSLMSVLGVLGIILVPATLTIVQPDLGTGLLIIIGGGLVLLLAGLQVRIILLAVAVAGAGAWIGWGFLHDYQRDRVLMFLNPELDPLGAGYHSIQSAIAIGSGGVFGRGWLHGSQGQLDFLPERSTDFIYAVVAEEFGLAGALFLIALYLFVLGRALYLALQTQNTFARLLSGSLALTFFVYVLINMGMVSGLLPVVGVPLPLFSYGGTSAVTLLTGFGILMSLYAHRKLVA